MGIVRMGVPEEFVLFMKRIFNLNTFIETGTFKGDTSCWAADHFETVITIELSKELYDEAVANYGHKQNIHFRFGDSSKELAAILTQTDGAAIFWLDAHHCSLNTAGKGLQPPILEEIRAITLSEYNHIILIDDARLFLAPPPDPHDIDEYPDIYTLLQELHRHKGYYALVIDDVIVCVPEQAREIVSRFCKKITTENDKKYWADTAAEHHVGFMTHLLFLLKAAANIVCRYVALKKSERLKWGKFQHDFNNFSALNNSNSRFPCLWEDRYPCFDDDTASTSYDRHYVLHPAWAMRILVQTKPAVHIDIASTLRFVTQLSCIMPVKHYDFRPPLLNIDNLECHQVDVTRLPFSDNSVDSLSCMHTLEHIGLGRYGDSLDSDGDVKAAGELARVLTSGGNLLVVVPVGRPRIAFNAHRIYSYRQVRELFRSLELKQYALIPDLHETGDIVYDASDALTDSQHHGCGCFWFSKQYVISEANR